MMGDLSENFSRYEFACGCRCGQADMDAQFIHKLQLARTWAGIPFRINSGFRCPQHNYNIGGAPNSLHLYGEAADTDIGGQSRNAYLILFGLHEAGFRRFKLYPKHIHVDSGRGKRSDLLMWGNYR
jgi:uncharacterized protein YcbK (DUF882 family)